MEEIHGAESWRLQNQNVSLAVSRQAGMVAPTRFLVGGRWVSPLAMAPWKPEDVSADLPPLLRFLRGDFFCLPFGPQSDGPPHGDPANAEWRKLEGTAGRLCLTTDACGAGSVEKTVELRDGETAIYYEFRISGLDGDWSYGNHPIIDCSAADEGSVQLSVSAFRWASVYEGVFSDPRNREYQALKEGARFTDLSEVPLANGGVTDLTRFPARQGYEDLVMMVNQEKSEEQPFAWSAAVFEDYVWFSLKDPADFPATLFWLSNGGRHEEPWAGRHMGRVGIEEVCSHFCDNVEISRGSHLAGEGIPTTRAFKKSDTVTMRLVQSVAPVPSGFGKVTSIVPGGPGRVLISGQHGDVVEAFLDWAHVLSLPLKS